MGKKDEYRFNLRFDETDEMHRLVVKYLNSCGHNKAKYIVRAFLAYWKMSGKSLLSYVFPEIDAATLTAHSGRDVPIATIVSPIINDGTFNFFAIPELPSTKKSAPLINSTKPTTSNTYVQIVVILYSSFF